MTKKSTASDTALPPVLASDGRSEALREFHKLREVLTGTHNEIPRLLAEERKVSRDLGTAEGNGENANGLRHHLEDLVQHRQAAVRRRAASVEGMLALEPSLQADRGAVEAERQEHAVKAVEAFQARYRAAVAVLQGLWEEGRVLAESLQAQVPMPLPVRVTTSPIDGTARALPIRTGAVAAVDATTARLAAQVSSLDDALGLIGGIRQAHNLDQREHLLARERGRGGESHGTYRVLVPFRSMIDGEDFTVGQLVDDSLIGPGSLHRLQTGRRFIVPVGLEAVAA